MINNGCVVPENIHTPTTGRISWGPPQPFSNFHFLDSKITPPFYHSEISLKSIMNNRVRVLRRGLYTITHFFWVPLPNNMVDEFNNPSHNSFSLASSERNWFAYLMKWESFTKEMKPLHLIPFSKVTHFCNLNLLI